MQADFEDLRWVNLEPGGSCNLKCPHCSRDASARDQGFMDMDLFCMLLEQVPDGCEVRLFLSGEPFLDPNLAERVALCRERGNPTLIHTNSTKITSEKALAVLAEIPTCISLSIDGKDAEEYEEMRTPAKFKEAVKGIACLIFAAAAYGNQTTLILQTIRKWPDPLETNADLDPKIIEHFDEVYVRHPHNWASMASVEGSAPAVYSDVCNFLINSISIQADGLVVPCCATLNAEHVMGDAKVTPLREIWETAHEDFRQRQSKKEPIPEICDGCERYQR